MIQDIFGRRSPRVFLILTLLQQTLPKSQDTDVLGIEFGGYVSKTNSLIPVSHGGRKDKEDPSLKGKTLKQAHAPPELLLLEKIFDHSQRTFEKQLPTDLSKRLKHVLPGSVCNQSRFKRNAGEEDGETNLVLVKIQSFIFDLPQKRENEYVAIGQLKQLMKPYPHLLLDPKYSEHIITSYNPLMLQRQVCKEFDNISTDRHVANTFFVVNDVGALVDRPMHDRLHRLFFQMTSALGIPSITWLPNRVGQFEMEDSQLAIRLEPLTWHVSHALVDFMHAFNWNLVIIVYNSMAPGSIMLVEELRKRQTERSAQDHPSFFEFEISLELQFHGLSSAAFSQCVHPTKRRLAPCLQPLLSILEKIWQADARVIIFNGNFFDLNTLLYIADSLENTEHAHLRAVFDEGYVWIFTPSTMSSLTVADNQAKVSADVNVLQESTMFRKIPGMFGFICLNDLERRKRNAELAIEIWQKAIIELVYQLTKIYPPEVPIIMDAPNQETLTYFGQILAKLRPEELCQDSEHLAWQWGRRMYDIMRTLTFNFNGEPISFLPNGGLNVSELYVYNSRITNGQMKWHKVGTWSMKSKWGRRKSFLRIDGVTWPGGANAPPKGRPNKFKLRVVTIKERPFVIYSKQLEDGFCDANSVPCKLRPQSVHSLDPPSKESDPRVSGIRTDVSSHRHLAVLNGTVQNSANHFSNESENRGNTTLYINGCCSGLTMDLLMELMKDLNFDVEVFEVRDGLWGAWTNNGWNGVVRTLIDEEADMAVTSLKITPNRSQQIEFSVPFLETGIAVVVGLREGVISPTAFLKPYDYQAWCGILIFSVHASAAALYIFEWISPNGMNRGRTEGIEQRFSFCRSLWLIWSMLFGAAVNADSPRAVASRFMANIWALFGLVFLAAYTANLAAFMIAKEDYYDLSGMNDWRLQQPWNSKPPFRFATIPSGATEENIKINFPEMGNYMKKFNRSTVELGLKALKANELDAFIYDANVLDYWASKDEGCKLRIVGNLYAMTGYGIGFSKGSRWVEKVNSRILDYQKNGKLQRWKKFWQTGSCRKDAALGNTNKTLGVKNFISAFVLLLSGMVLCSFILLLEHCLYRLIRAREKRTKKRCCLAAILPATEKTQLEEDERRQSTVRCTDPDCMQQIENWKQEANALRDQVRLLQKQLTTEVTDSQGDSLFSQEKGQVVPICKEAASVASEVDRWQQKQPLLKVKRSSAPTNTGVKKPRGEKHQPHDHARLWDIYSKVAVTPVGQEYLESPKRLYVCEHMNEEKDVGEDNAQQIIVIPKLNQSPSRRRIISKAGTLMRNEERSGITNIHAQNHTPVASVREEQKTFHSQNDCVSRSPHETRKTSKHHGSFADGLKTPSSFSGRRPGLRKTKEEHSVEKSTDESYQDGQSASLLGRSEEKFQNEKERRPPSIRRQRNNRHRELRFVQAPHECRESSELENIIPVQHPSDSTQSAFEKESVL